MKDGTQETGVRRQEMGDRTGLIGHYLAVILASGFWLLTSPPQARSSEGGTGEPNDPYRIATAEQLLAIGSDPNLLDKHFTLVADIDLDPKLPGGRTLIQAAIAPAVGEEGSVSGDPFTGVLDGRGHMIRHLTIRGRQYSGLFGRLAAGAEVRDLGVVDVNITGYGTDVGGLAGYSEGSVIRCFSTGVIGNGTQRAGGLVGWNVGTLLLSYSTAAITADNYAGGLVGTNEGRVLWCYAQGRVKGDGGPFGSKDRAAGLVAYNKGSIACCYSTCEVGGSGLYAGGLVGENAGHVSGCFWDTQTSGRVGSAGGRGFTTAQMQDPQTYLTAGWDLVGESANGTSEVWQMPGQGGYPVLAILSGYLPRSLRGQGTPDDPYLIADACDLGAMVYQRPDSHYRLVASVDLAGVRWSTAVLPTFSGAFDGNGLEVSHLVIAGGDYLGLFGEVAASGEVRDLSLADVNVSGSGGCVGSLAGSSAGAVTRCGSTGEVAASGQSAGGLVGSNRGRVSYCHATGHVTCTGSIRMSSGFGGLVGWNSGDLMGSYSTADVQGSDGAGGLVGYHDGPSLSQCFATGQVSGGHAGGLVAFSSTRITDCHSSGRVLGSYAGGLVANNGGSAARCYSTGQVSGGTTPVGVGGLIGQNSGLAVQCFWDIQTSGQAHSAAGAGRTTSQMQDIQTYLDAGWDFVGETANGTHEIWQMPQSGGYPVLAIQNGYVPPVLKGLGTAQEPYLVATAHELGAVIHYSPISHYRLASSIDLAGIHWGSAVIPEFAGTFDGNGLTISHLTLQGSDTLGLFGKMSGSVLNLRLADANVTATGDFAGSLAGLNAGLVTQCTGAGSVSGYSRVGGLIGSSEGPVFQSSFAGSVAGVRLVGGLLGDSRGTVTRCTSAGQVSGDGYIGGLAGANQGSLTDCYSISSVLGTGLNVAGLAGWNAGTVVRCYSAGRVSGGPYNHGGLVVANTGHGVRDSFWDTQASDQTTSDGGTGRATAQMQSAGIFVNAGWDFVNTWSICEGKDYPRLRWEGRQCEN
jgi:hypothetical protein